MEEPTLPVPDPPPRHGSGSRDPASVAQFVTFICVCVVVESWVGLVAESCDISIINRAAQRRLLLRKDGTRTRNTLSTTVHRAGWLVALDVAWEKGYATNIMFEVAAVSVATCRAS
jgi:hypothetical protein